MTIDRCRNGTEFVVSRFSRLYPVYWVAVLITYVVSVTFPIKATPHTLWELAVNMTMLSGFVKVPYIDGVYWSLTYELGFYFAVLSIFMIGMLRHMEKFCWLWVLGSIWFHYWSALIPHPLHFLFVIHSYGHLFAVGIALYRMQRGGITMGGVALIVAAIIAQFLSGGITDTIAVTICIALVIAALTGILTPFCIRPLLWLGSISYPLYLIHENAGWSLLARLYAAGLTPAMAISIAAFAAILLASALHVLVEDPAMRLIRRAFKQRRSQSVSA
jgi:peptidoglycan/LPS O-acetylase OafA/YrhL